MRRQRGKRILVQIGRGDPVVVNPGTLDLVREGGLQATTCLFWPERSAWHDHLGVEAQPLVHVFAVIQPIFAANCFGCHGPDAKQRQAELDLSDFSGVNEQKFSSVFLNHAAKNSFKTVQSILKALI